jgi:phosphohistidine phosphatase
VTSTLILLRHAKSAYPQGVSDHDRPLNARGRRDAPVAGSLIADVVPGIELALVSTARRAQQTWELARPSLQVGRQTDVPELYLPSPDTMLRRIRAVSATTLLVVSHNPGTEDLAERLTRNTDDRAYRAMVTKFPTAAFAVLESDAALPEWGFGTATLRAFEVGRG